MGSLENLAFMIVGRAFEGKVDKAGEPYIKRETKIPDWCPLRKS